MGKAYLVLADGTAFEGTSFGAETDAIGELTFTTGVVGYGETLTNPCHAGQIVLQTFPLIGNYGVIEEDLPEKCAAAGYVVRQWCDAPSNFRSQYDIDTYLKKHNIPGVCGIDTRALTGKIRDEGVMNAMICREIPADLSIIRSHSAAVSLADYSCTEKTIYSVENAKYSVAMLDLGAKHRLIADLNGRGCSVTLYPYNTSAEEILAGGHSGLLLSDGPENADANPHEIAKLMGKTPMFGVGLGHQLMALASGGQVKKMKFGHHGSNQPVKHLAQNRCYITAQSHGYAVVSVPKGNISFVNVNDQSCEGMDYPDQQAFSVQFVPECCIGPNDTSFLYDRFISMMGGDLHAAE